MRLREIIKFVENAVSFVWSGCVCLAFSKHKLSQYCRWLVSNPRQSHSYVETLVLWRIIHLSWVVCRKGEKSECQARKGKDGRKEGEEECLPGTDENWRRTKE